MRTTDYFAQDLLAFFAGRPEALTLFEALYRQLEALFPDASVRVQKSQISFYGRHLFSMASLPRRQGAHGLVLSFGLPVRLDAPRIDLATEPYPGRWTHHLTLTDPAQLDDELLGWLRAAWTFSEGKR